MLEKAFGDWSGAGGSSERSTAIAIPVPQTHDGLRVYLIHRDSAVQTVIRFAAPAPAPSDPSRIKLEVLETIFGGTFTSRLNRNIREEHGYSYGARAGYSLMRGAGYFAASSSVKSDVTGAALGEFIKEFGRLRGGPIGATFVVQPRGDITDAEIGKAVQTIQSDTAQAFQGHAGPMNAAAARIVQGLGYSAIAEDLAALASISAADVNLMARDATPLERGVLLLVGDRAVILEQIKDLDLPAAVELTATGEPVKR